MANETVIETLVSRYTGDATGYEKAVKDIEKANKEVIATTDQTAASLKQLSSTMSDGIGEGISAMKRFGVDKFFKVVEEDAAATTTQLAKAGDELRKWGRTETFLAGFANLRDMFVKFYESAKLLASDDLPNQFGRLWAAASTAVVGSFAKVKAAAAATWAVVAASPVAAVAAIAAVAVAIGVAINAFNNYRNKAEQLRQEFEQNAKDREQERKEFQKETQEMLARSERATGPGLGTKMLKEELINAGELWEQASERVEEAQQKVMKNDSFFKTLGRSFAGIGADIANFTMLVAGQQELEDFRETRAKRRKEGGQIADYFGSTEESKRVKEEAKAAQEEMDKVNERIATLRERLKDVGTHGLANIQNMRKEMEGARETLGMGDTEKRLHSLNKQLEQLQTHASSVSFMEIEDPEKDIPMLEEIWKKVAQARREVNAATIEAIQLEQEQKQTEFKTHLKDTVKELERQVDVIGLSAKQLAIYNAEQKAAAAGTVLSAKDRANLQELHDAVDAKKKLHELEEQGKKLNKENAGPEEKYRNTVTELNTMLDKGYITQDTYNKAVEKAGNEFDKTGEKAKKAHNDILKYEHALVGSLEASDRLEKQRTLFDEQGRDKRARPKVDSRLALDSALKDVETPRSRLEKEEKLMQQQNDWLMKIYEIMLQDEQDEEANQNFIGITGLEITA